MSCPVFGACGCFVLSVFPVAAAMFWPCPALSVICVAEVPLVCGCDWLSAFGAGVCFACGQSCLPCPAEVAVCCVVSSCCRAAALPLVCVCVDGAEACALFDELWAVVPGASAETHVALPPSVAVVSGMSWVRHPRSSPDQPQPFMGYRCDWCRRICRRPFRIGPKGFREAPCRTELIIANAAGYE